MAKSFSFPLYVAETESGERIAGPSLSCTRMQIAALSYERFAGAQARVLYFDTLSASEAALFSGQIEPHHEPLGT